MAPQFVMTTTCGATTGDKVGTIFNVLACYGMDVGEIVPHCSTADFVYGVGKYQIGVIRATSYPWVKWWHVFD